MTEPTDSDLIAEDTILLREIADAEPEEIAHLAMTYWQDKNRSDRTPRNYMYFHIGLICGAMMSMKRIYMGHLEALNEKLQQQIKMLEKVSDKLEM